MGKVVGDFGGARVGGGGAFEEGDGERGVMGVAGEDAGEMEGADMIGKDGEDLVAEFGGAIELGGVVVLTGHGENDRGGGWGDVEHDDRGIVAEGRMAGYCRRSAMAQALMPMGMRMPATSRAFSIFKQRSKARLRIGGAGRSWSPPVFCRSPMARRRRRMAATGGKSAVFQ